MASIQQLPDEIILQIFDFCGSCDPTSGGSSYHSLSLVNHRFHGLASSLVYKEYPLYGFPDDHCDVWRIGLWTRTLLEDESKAAMVQTVTLGLPSQATFFFQNGRQGQKQSSLYALTESGAQCIRDTLATAFEDEAKQHAQWTDLCLDQKSVNYVLALVILRLPHLSFLQLWGATRQLWLCLNVLFDGLDRSTKQEGVGKPFQELRTVSYGPTRGYKFPDISEPLAIATKWPSIEMLVGGNTADGYHEFDAEVSEEYKDLKPRSTGLKQIKLRAQCKLLPEHLYRLVGSAEALQTFEYDIGNAWAWIPIDTPAVSRALEQHATSLQRITLHHARHEEESTEQFSHNFSPMIFSHFSGLEQLEISFLLLFGHQDQISSPALRAHLFQALPSSITSFSIVQCATTEVATAAMDVLVDLARQNQQRFKSLQRLMLAVYSGNATRGATSNMQEAFKHRVWPISNNPEIKLNLCADCWLEGLVVGAFVEIPHEDKIKSKEPREAKASCCEIHAKRLAPIPPDDKFYD